MIDLITYVPDILAMGIEGVEIANNESHELNGLFTVDEGGTLTFNVAKIPVKYITGNSSLCLCRGLTREQLSLSNTIQVIGECINNKYVFDSDESRSIYEDNYDRTTVIIDDVEYTPHYMIGVFS
jgi:hypothetical protein